MPLYTDPQSLEAYRGLQAWLGLFKAAIVAEIVSAEDNGLTCDELEVILDARHQTVSGAITALKGMDLIKPKVRPTRSGRKATILVAA